VVARLTKLAGTTSLRETRRHEGDQLPSFLATPLIATLLSAPSGAMVGRPWHLPPLSVLTLAKSEEARAWISV
jgi:hypothetical protein